MSAGTTTLGDGGTWRVLVIDDDPDVHAVTKLVLKSKTWRNQRFELISAHSQAEATKLLKQDQDFHVALVDVVMEREDSGLELCGVIREICPRSTRIVLRTGQAGIVPEEKVLNEYDIDYYLNKLDMTPEKLFTVVRACLRSSQDISTLLAYGRQLQSFTRALQYMSSVDNLVVFMGETLRFLEVKHNCTTTFNYDLSLGGAAVIRTNPSATMEQDERHLSRSLALKAAHEAGAPLMHEHPGTAFGLDASNLIMIFEAREENSGDAAEIAAPTLGGIVFTMNSGVVSDGARRDLAADARLFIENWCIAFSTLRLRERLNHEQELRNQMYHDRLEGIATMVTGVAHELNTPLGVARTAASAAGEFADELLRNRPGSSPEDDETAASLNEAVRLMNKNLDRAHRLIQSFRKLSASQLSDERVTTDIKVTIEDCMETMSPDLKKHGITARVEAQEGLDLLWNGFPGHLSQVIINLTQNAIKYAYEPGTGGTIDVFIENAPKGDGFRIRFADHGKGVLETIKPRMFDAFVTSGRDTGGTGLGLAIVRNIVTNLLHGSIACDSEVGGGTRFTIDLPTTRGNGQDGSAAIALTAAHE
ncbi:hybrid sensor histidine kinase/response regulator [Microbispora sp. NEAU-D428]|uniref:hybrid sensor histidine kinase/response regulator n=1 Tax=Microbispora sitophila TaxID=2771537 RepID=UPI0018690BD5|nr:hybrid sensor histidine kinase/response regulator [Microbispora sitophila]MBE3016059.1 hybrid sensor histidine kinase/response regulator [Microbispora sitophila]